MASDQDQIDRLTAESDQKGAQLAALSEQLKQAAGFRNEALAARDRIAELEADLEKRESALVTTIRDLSEARAVAASATGKNENADAKLAAALQFADAFKILTK